MKAVSSALKNGEHMREIGMIFPKNSLLTDRSDTAESNRKLRKRRESSAKEH
jgi:hypothetical protein